ncbi:T9SS type A sorting domain-containing protein, partial [candidate division WOR-3 bacterium]|nr:T9SS type A sorting domain-containing protein [candidate division WOR-3 bacterium]
FSVLPSIFRRKTLINLAIINESRVNISAYNVVGQRVDVILNQICKPGLYNINWTTDNLPSGIYFVRIESNDIKEVKKVVHLR